MHEHVWIISLRACLDYERDKSKTPKISVRNRTVKAWNEINWEWAVLNEGKKGWDNDAFEKLFELIVEFGQNYWGDGKDEIENCWQP